MKLVKRSGVVTCLCSLALFSSGWASDLSVTPSTSSPTGTALMNDVAAPHAQVASDLDVIYRFNDDRPIKTMFFGSDGYLYGIRSGWSDGGFIFKIKPDGSAYQEIYRPDNPSTVFGQTMIAGPDGYLYATLFYWPVNPRNTTFFRIHQDSATMEPLGNMLYPPDSLVFGSDGYLYGADSQGGDAGDGRILKFDPANHFSYTVLHTFNHEKDGAFSPGSLVLGKDGYIYGAAGGKPTSTIFKINQASGAFTTLYTLPTNFSRPSLTLGKDGWFYGVSGLGGDKNGGAIFKINPANNAFTLLHFFNYQTEGSPNDGLTLGTDGSLYGTLGIPQQAGNTGSIFKVNPTDGTATTRPFYSNGLGEPNPLTLGGDGNLYGGARRYDYSYSTSIFRYRVQE